MAHAQSTKVYFALKNLLPKGQKLCFFMARSSMEPIYVRRKAYITYIIYKDILCTEEHYPQGEGSSPFYSGKRNGACFFIAKQIVCLCVWRTASGLFRPFRRAKFFCEPYHLASTSEEGVRRQPAPCSLIGATHIKMMTELVRWVPCAQRVTAKGGLPAIALEIDHFRIIN